MSKLLSVALLFALSAAGLGYLHLEDSANAGETDPVTTASVKRGPSGLPLPRFVSIKAEKVNLRIGPGRDYPVDWMYTRSGLPVEIVQEYDNWRKIRDAEGTEGWIYQSLLTGRRTGTAAPWQDTGKLVAMHETPGEASAIVARVEPGAIGRVVTCDGRWCHMDFSGHEGWMKQPLVWGVYPGETIED